MTTEAVILAGGIGARLSQVVPGLPKPMAPIGDRAFLEILLLKLKRSGLTDVVLSVGYKANVIQERFGNEFEGLRIKYAVEDHPLGTGGAIRASLGHVNNSLAFVLNGDTYTDLDFSAMMTSHRRFGRPLSIAALELGDASRYGRMEVKHDIVINFSEKTCNGPGIINAGVYILEKHLLLSCGLADPFSFEKDFLVPRVSSLRPYAFKTSAYFIDIGIPRDYERAQRDLVAHK